jgi:hypothetical protein
MEHLKAFIYGKLLGDGHLEKPAKASFNSRLKIKQKEDHKEYVEQCYKKMHNYTTKMYYDGSVRIYNGVQKKHFAWTFKSKALPFFTELRKLWYQDSIKILPKDLETYFTAETLAYWYLDDGYVQIAGKYIRCGFCTDSFTEKEVERLIDILKSFGILSFKTRYKTNFRIEVRKEEVLKMFELIKQYVPNCMTYKIRTPQ